MYFPRMLDKIRQYTRGELHEDYHENLGSPRTLDGACCNFLRVNYEDLRERTRQGGLTKKFLSGVFKAAGNRMRVISLSGMDSYRNSDGATLSVQDWRKGKRNSASPIAQTFSQWPT